MTDVSFEDFRRHFLLAPRVIGMTFEEKGRWMPHLMLDTPEGLDIVELGDMAGSDAEWATALADTLPKLVAHRQARLYVLIAESWTVTPTLEQLPQTLEIGATDHPDRVECLLAHFAGLGRSETWLAEIERVAGEPPVLSPWRLAGEPLVGVRTEALDAAIDLVARSN